MNSLIVALLAFLGLSNAAFLYWQIRRYQKEGVEMFCVVGDSCSDVVLSRYGSTFGVKNEIFGMLYYVAMVFFALGYLFFERELFLLLAKSISIPAVLFSIYLLFCQTVILKKLCLMCLLAIGINIGIFFAIV